MKININNYESFFLLYVDNELSDSEREMVENFALQNPALKEELELLQQTILPAGEITDFDKSLLCRNGVNLAQTMLMQLDNELGEKERTELMRKIESDDQLQAEWKILQKTKLDASELIPFPNKKILYKKEPAKIINLNILKWAVAAAVMAGGIFWAVSINEIAPGGADTESLANRSQITNNGKEITSGASSSGAKVDPAQLADNAMSTEIKNTNKQVPVTAEKNIAAVKKDRLEIAAKKANAVSTPGNDEQPVLASNKNNNPQTISKADISILNLKKTNADKPEMLAAISSKEKPKNAADPIDHSIMPVEDNYASMASLNETENNDHIFLLDQEKFADSKAGVLFKKIKRTVTRTTNISPGKTLKIAGFEFAVK